MPKNDKTNTTRGDHKHKPHREYWKRYGELVNNPDYWLKFWTKRLIINRTSLVKARQQENNAIRISKLERDRVRIEDKLKTIL